MVVEYDSDELTALLIAYAHAQGDVPEGVEPRVEVDAEGVVMTWSVVDIGSGWGGG